MNIMEKLPQENQYLEDRSTDNYQRKNLQHQTFLQLVVLGIGARLW